MANGLSKADVWIADVWIADVWIADVLIVKPFSHAKFCWRIVFDLMIDLLIDLLIDLFTQHQRRLWQT